MKRCLARLPGSQATTIWLGLIYAMTVAGIASYGQALIVVQAADGPTRISYLVAALADPIAFTASVNILDARQRDKEWAWWSIIQVLFALAVTVGFNVMAGRPHDVPPYLVRAWPAVAVGMTLHSLFDFRRRRAQPAPAPAAAPVRSRSAPRKRTRPAPVSALDAETEFMDELAAGTVPSIREIRARLHVGQERGKALREHLAGLVRHG